MIYRKKLFTEKNSFLYIVYAKIIELHVAHTWHHIQPG